MIWLSINMANDNRSRILSLIPTPSAETRPRSRKVSAIAAEKAVLSAVSLRLAGRRTTLHVSYNARPPSLSLHPHPPTNPPPKKKPLIPSANPDHQRTLRQTTPYHSNPKKKHKKYSHDPKTHSLPSLHPEHIQSPLPSPDTYIQSQSQSNNSQRKNNVKEEC